MITSDDPRYTISTMDGSREIQNGGSTPRPSLISSLTVNMLNEFEPDTYTFHCSAPSAHALANRLTIIGMQLVILHESSDALA